MEHDPTRLYRGPVGYALEPIVRRLRGHGLAHRYPWVWKAHRVVWRLTRSNRVIIEGHDMLLDPGDSCCLAAGEYEPGETRWYKEHVKPGDLVVEVGANVGFFALLLARLVGSDGRVLSFEPDPDLNAILRRNGEFNGYPQLEVRQAAVADRVGSATFYRSPVTTGDHRLHSHGPRDISFPVEVTTLDHELAGNDRRIDLLKMDIQGAEPLALRGAGTVLAEAPPRRILMEYWPHGITGMGCDPREPVQTLMDAGYVVERLDGKPWDLEAALSGELTPESENWVNLICTHVDGAARS